MATSPDGCFSTAATTTGRSFSTLRNTAPCDSTAETIGCGCSTIDRTGPGADSTDETTGLDRSTIETTGRCLSTVGVDSPEDSAGDITV
jgi:hypothetical protein